MSKYLYGFKLFFLNSFQYRFNTIVGLIFGNLSMIVTISFWNLIYGGDTTKVLNGFTLSGMITYFIVAGVFRSFTLQGSGFQYTNLIKSGSLGALLLKPYNLSMAIYFQHLANCITGIIPQLALVLFVMPLISRFLTWQMSGINALFIIGFLLIASVSSHLLWSLFGYMAFWLEEATAVMWSLAVLLNMAMGMFIPLDFFPKWSISILEKLPFSAWGYIPTKIYLGYYSLEKQLTLLFVHLVWVGVLIVLHKLVWVTGLKRFSSVGG